ncbi:GNAT family N-acetyltransferase [Criblamydia sequanensis]|uniref:Uncharacterized protein n=1 Tax=Candidatus Criblamydia sequanensis CRIB-18 TaxID=1437425 RepID=A0A090CZM5_9BACT|nr:GNAT family protein [Criblamydia sequanensis]CDR34401.1 hypothetical protein CSEC_1587 [Criblamydia sequanensis CRIB-18]
MNEAPPFSKEGQYNGRVQISLFHSWYPSSKPSEPESLPILFPSIESKRLSILPFTEPYKEEFKAKFNHRFSSSFPDQEEIATISRILEQELSISGSVAEALINKDSLRILENNPLTGYRLIEKGSNKIIGRVCMEEYAKGRVKCDIVLDKDYQNQQYGKEAAITMLFFAIEYVSRSDLSEKGRVQSFVSILDGNDERSIKLAKYLGMVAHNNPKELELDELASHQQVYEIPTDYLNAVYRTRFIKLDQRSLLDNSHAKNWTRH